ncbi:DUF3592 domain-containing protein [Paenibacillus sp. GCM10027627]|uniref:DUF3592 domain-containing protein n=1 Tax=unclassified Paenibacillus TaxID=185978 RepID=UPI00363DED10
MKKLHWMAWITLFASYKNLLLYLLSFMCCLITIEHMQLDIKRPNMSSMTTAEVIKANEAFAHKGSYIMKYEFSYTVNGEHYVGGSEERRASSDLPSYIAGETVQIVYNPRYPHVSEIVGTTNKTHYLPVSIGITFLFIIMLAFSIWRGTDCARTLRTGNFSQGYVYRTNNHYNASHTIGRQSFYRMFLYGYKLKESKSAKIIYNPLKPSSFYILSRLPVKYIKPSNTWQPSVYSFILRILITAFILLLSYSSTL